MKLNLEGKKALVTGSSTGIGEFIAKLLSQEGVRVMIHGRNEEELKRVREEIRQAGGDAEFVIGDLSNDQAAKNVATETLNAFGSVDILINNAGIFYQEHTWSNGTSNQWLELYNSNVLSAVRMVHLLAPQMKQKGWGRIIQIASGAAIDPPAFMPDYSATKGAMIDLSVSLAKELGASGITVNSVSPGPIMTQKVESSLKKMAKEKGWGKGWEKDFIEQFGNATIPRFGRPEEVAAMVVFLCSPKADYITASNFRVDGGMVGTVN